MSQDGEPAKRLARARAIIARHMLGEELSTTALGDIVLLPHQRRAVARVRTLLGLTGGAMLADATGLGKTFVALAVAGPFHRTLVVAPASLTGPWQEAISRTRATAAVMSMECLSRGAASPLDDPELVIIDEAHHFRNPSTKRYIALAALCDRAFVLLLSATPLQNRRADLIAQCGLFLGDAAATATDEELARLVVRRRAADLRLQLPAVVGPRRVELPIEDDLLDDLLALPPPLPGADEGSASALLTYTLLRQWASSRAALVSGLRRRLVKSLALINSLEVGRWPTRAELMAWTHEGDAVQLALPELLSPVGTVTHDSLIAMRIAVEAHAAALRRLLARMRLSADPDSARATLLAEIQRAHPDARVIAFSQYADTVHVLSRLLMSRLDGVAELTSRGGRVAGGRISRREVLAQFTPTTGERAVSAAERIGFLVTTDVLSEGLDLQRAVVVVHLDLPWNPARLEQRVGRVRRLGSPHDTVFVYMLAPPANAERVLRVEARLREKLGLASRVIGVGDAFVEARAQPSAAPPELVSEVLAVLERWRGVEPDHRSTGIVPHVAAVLAPHNGFLALLAAAGGPILLAAEDSSAPSRNAAHVVRALSMCEGIGLQPTAEECNAALASIVEWCGHWSLQRRLAVSSPNGARLRAAINARIRHVLASASRHKRAVVTSLASHAQRTLAVALGAGAERVLAGLAAAGEANEEWLWRVASLAEGRPQRTPAAREPEPVVVIVLRRETAA